MTLVVLAVSALVVIISVVAVVLYARGSSRRVSPQRPEPEPARGVRLDRFWEIVGGVATAASGEARIEALRDALSTMHPDDIETFAARFEGLMSRAFTWDLWNAAYVIGGGCSDDAFMDFRTWLISCGRDVYEAALADPDSLAAVVEDDAPDACFALESYRYVPVELLEELYERELSGDGGTVPLEPAGERLDETGDALRERCPRLWARFAEGPLR